MSYESGYVRRKYSGRNWRGNVINTVYQLNKTRQVPVTYTGWDGNLYSSTKTERILVSNHEDRMDIIYRAATNYRRTLGKI
jgi:hypothetical protein